MKYDDYLLSEFDKGQKMTELEFDSLHKTVKNLSDNYMNYKLNLDGIINNDKVWISGINEAHQQHKKEYFEYTQRLIQRELSNKYSTNHLLMNLKKRIINKLLSMVDTVKLYITSN